MNLIATHSPSKLDDLLGDETSMPRYLRIRDVLRISGLSRPTLYRRIAIKRFPPSVHLGGRACGWHTSALREWMRDPEGYLFAARCMGPAHERLELRDRRLDIPLA